MTYTRNIIKCKNEMEVTIDYISIYISTWISENRVSKHVLIMS